MNELIEQLSAAVHTDWMEEQVRRGRKSSIGRDGEEYMVPYADLSEPAKELDRVTVRAVLKHLTEKGLGGKPTDSSVGWIAQATRRGA